MSYLYYSISHRYPGFYTSHLVDWIKVSNGLEVNPYQLPKSVDLLRRIIPRRHMQTKKAKKQHAWKKKNSPKKMHGNSC